MSHSATAERTKTRRRRLEPASVQHNPQLVEQHRTGREIRAALDAIPAGSVTARTAGALRVADPLRTIEEERTAFEQAVAEENAGPTEG